MLQISNVKYAKQRPTMRFLKFIAVTATAWLLTTEAWADSRFDGRWKINFEESEKVSISYEEGSGSGRSKILQNMNVSVMGLPLPTLRHRVGPQSSLAPKNPDVLLCTFMDVEVAKDRVALTYDEGKKETLRKGDYRGRNTKWSKREIKQKYKTPDRKVTKTWRIRDDGRLLVEVKLDPPRDRSRTYRRVFDRVALDDSTATTEPSEAEG